jgi:Xaa-Pro aminopeptidase
MPVTQSLLRRYSQVFPVGSAGTRFPESLKRRRKAHLESLDSFAIFAGVPREPGAENLWHMNAWKLFQEPAIMHLCGINQPNVILALVPGTRPGDKSSEVLFIPEKNPAREFWDGVRFGIPPVEGDSPRKHASARGRDSHDLQDVRALTGITDVRPLPEFEDWFKALVRRWKKKHGYAYFHRYADPGGGKVHLTKTDHNFAFAAMLERLARGARKGFALRSCAALHHELRLPLDKDQQRDVARAVAVTRAAFVETLPEIRGLRTETELEARLQYGMLRRSPFGLAFPSIIAGGRNATVLHYLKNDEPLPKSGLVLMDFGARWGTMHADITRVVPVSGKFNPLQALIYGIVLDAAKLNQRNARPGATIRALNDKVWDFIEKALEARFFSKGGKAFSAYKGKPHGVSHLMGEQEHDGDPHRLYQDFPLQPGWQISNEPGLYGHFAVTLNGRRYSEWIGVRIEDDLLITEKGCRNLSASIPREVEEIEGLMARERA